MKEKKHVSVLFAALVSALLLMTTLSGCGKRDLAAETAEPDRSTASPGPTEPVELPASEAETGRQDGEGQLSDEQALSAIKRYCYIGNPDLERIVNAGEYPVYWDISSSDEFETVVLFRSYTGAQIRYYINRMTGDTYVTEFVPGIMSEEQRTEESFNLRDYLSDVTAADRLSGTWQTASVGYADDGTMSPEYYVRFTDSEICYGHLKDGDFVLDHSDPIIRLEELPAGGVKVQAETSNGAPYTYQTSESDNAVLEYFETWTEADFPEMYRGGASLSRSNG